MLTADLDHVTSLEEFYSSIRSQQEEYHGHDYCHHHDAITKYMENCDSYKELGTHQGGTAAAAVFTHPKKVTLVDMDMGKFNKNRKHFEKYCEDNNIDLEIIVSDSTSINTIGDGADCMLIDSRHVYQHIKKELAVHGKTIRKYIIAHDTNSKPELQRALEEYCQANPEWEMLEYHKENVGYSVIGRKS
jgi:galactitol-specific phosphotransferase system IIB component